LLTAFAAFCVLVVTVPLAIRSYIVNTTTIEETALMPINETVHVKEPNGTDFVAVSTSRADILEGAVVETGERSLAFLRLFENSTLTLHNDTRVFLERVRSPRFTASSRANEVVVRVESGRVVIGVAGPTPPLERALHMAIQSPHAEIILEGGSYSVVVDEEQTQLTIIRPGEATVTAQGETRRFENGRCRITKGMPIEGPLLPEQNLIINGDFSDVLELGWETQAPQRQDENDPYGSVQIVETDGKPVLSFERRGARTHGENSITQRIDKDVRDFSSLQLTCEVLVSSQSLRGGGYESTEFPVMIELMYRDTFGNQQWRYWGFYYKDPGTGPEWRTIVNGTKVIQGEWYLFETGNLMQPMGDAPPPVHIESVRVYASGWDWDSAIANIALLVKE
jgi:hypothetical protein